MSWRNELTVGLLRAERIFYGTANGGLGSELTTTELGYLDDITPGTAAASKALILDANADLTSGINDFTVDNDLTVGGGLSVTGAIDITSGIWTLGVADTTEGDLTIYGAATGAEEGGRVVLQLAADYDTTINQFEIQAYEDDLMIGPNTDLDSLIYSGANDSWAVTGGRLDVGADDTTDGSIYVYGGAAAAGGGVRLYLGATYDTTIDYFEIGVYEDDLMIGPSTDTDFMVLDKANERIWMRTSVLGVGQDDTQQGSLWLYGHGAGSSAGGQIYLYTPADYDSTILAYSIQAYEDDLNIGPATDMDSLRYIGDTGVWSFTGTGGVSIGVADTTRGLLDMYGPTNGDLGARIRIYNSGDYDATTDYWYIQTYDGDLWIGGSNALNDPVMIMDDSTGKVTFTSDSQVDIDSGNLTVGVDDLVRGHLQLYSQSGESEGGKIWIYTGPNYDTTINYFQIQANSDDLEIGPATNTTAIQYTGGDSALRFRPTGGVYMYPASGQSQVHIGVDDSIDALVHLYGDSGSEGGKLRIYNAGGYDNNISYWQIGNGSDQGLSISAVGATFFLKFDYDNSEFVFDGGNVVVDDQLEVDGGQATIGEAGTIYGTLVLEGHATGNEEGGKIWIKTADDYDAVITEYYIDAYEDDLRIGPSNKREALKYDGANSRWDMDVDLVINPVGGTANLYVGADGSNNGIVYVYGGTDSGPQLYLYNGSSYDNTVEYYRIGTGTGPAYDDLFIGPDTDPDALIWDASNARWDFTTANGVYVSGGDLVASHGRIDIGVDDTGAAGELNVYGGQSGNGIIRIYFPGDYDDTYTDFQFVANSSDEFTMGPNTDTDALKYAGGEWVFTSGSGVDIQGTFQLNNTTVTATAAELNYLDIAALGTGVASKAVVVDGNGNFVFAAATVGIDFATNSAPVLLGAGDWKIDGTAVNSTAVELDTFYLNIHIPDISTNTYAAVVVPTACTFEKVESVLWGTIATADDVLTFTTSSGAVTNTLTIAYSGSAAGDIDTMTPGDNQACSAGSAVSLSNTAASTNSIPVTLTLHFKVS
jgi:hypothetical protein